MNAKALREKFGNNLDGSFGGKTLTQTEKDRVAELEDSNKQLADKKKSLQKMTESGFVAGEGENGAASVPATPAQLKKAKDEIANLSTQMDGNNAELSKIGTDRAPMSASEMHKVQADAAIDGSIGKSQGIKDAMDKSKGGNEDIYRQNAQYGELSNQLKTDAKVQAQGGVEKAANIDASESAIKSKEQMGALDGKVQELAKGANVSAEDADKLGKKVAEGGATAAELMKAGILSSAQSLASAQSGAKTGKDLETLKQFDSADDFIEGNSREGIKDGAKLKTMSDFSDDDDAKNTVLQSEYNAAKKKSSESAKKYAEDAIAYGFAVDDGNGNLVAADSEGWTRGRATASASGMERDERIVAGGGRMNTTYNPLTGEALTNFDAGQTTTAGSAVKVLATDGEDFIAISKADGDLDKAADIKQNAGAIKAYANPANQVAYTTASVTSDGTQETGSEEIGAWGGKEWSMIGAGVFTTWEVGSALSKVPKNMKDGKGVIPKTGVTDAQGNQLYQDSDKNEIKRDKEGFFTEDAKGGRVPYEGDTNKLDQKLRPEGGHISEGVRSAGGSARKGLKKASDFALERMGAERVSDAEEGTNNGGSAKQDQKGREEPKGVGKEIHHNNPPKNYIDKDILASIKDDVNPLKAKGALESVSNEGLAKQALADGLQAKRAEVMESGVLSPEEKTARLAKISSAEKALAADGAKVNRNALVGNPKNPGVFTQGEFDKLGMVQGEKGQLDFETSGENMRSVREAEIAKAEKAAPAPSGEPKNQEQPKAPKALDAAQQASQKVQLNEIAKQKASLDTDTPQGEADSKRLSQMEDYVKENGSLKGYAEVNNVPQSTMQKYGLDNKSLDAIDSRPNNRLLYLLFVYILRTVF